MTNVPWRNKSPYGWWIASYIQRFEWKGKPPKSPRARCDAWENTILVRGNNRDAAYRKAVAFGKRACPRLWELHGDPPGRLGRWVYEGLTSLIAVYEPIEDGSEILWTEHANTTLGAVRRRCKRKRMLETYQDGSNA